MWWKYFRVGLVAIGLELLLLIGSFLSSDWGIFYGEVGVGISLVFGLFSIFVIYKCLRAIPVKHILLVLLGAVFLSIPTSIFLIFLFISFDKASSLGYSSDLIHTIYSALILIGALINFPIYLTLFSVLDRKKYK